MTNIEHTKWLSCGVMAWLAIAGSPLADAQLPPSAEGQSEVVDSGRASAREVVHHTFSIAAIDPVTGEVGVAVTTRNGCVGNGVPWVRVGVGAVATQARTRTRYGFELLDALEAGRKPSQALEHALEQDDGAPYRQIGVINNHGESAQHTGSETSSWAGHRAGVDYVAQGNTLVGAEVIDAVADSFVRSSGSARHLSDRLIDALEAGQRAGGDARKGKLQSASVVVADPREGHSRRDDGISTHINVCEHPTPVAELRRIFDTLSQSLGYRDLQQFSGRDVVQLRLMLRALGLLAASEDAEPSPRFDRALVDAVEAFRESEGLATSANGSPPGLVDSDTVRRLWSQLEAKGLADPLRKQFVELTRITR